MLQISQAQGWQALAHDLINELLYVHVRSQSGQPQSLETAGRNVRVLIKANLLEQIKDSSIVLKGILLAPLRILLRAIDTHVQLFE